MWECLPSSLLSVCIPTAHTQSTVIWIGLWNGWEISRSGSLAQTGWIISNDCVECRWSCFGELGPTSRARTDSCISFTVWYVKQRLCLTFERQVWNSSLTIWIRIAVWINSNHLKFYGQILRWEKILLPDYLKTYVGLVSFEAVVWFRLISVTWPNRRLLK